MITRDGCKNHGLWEGGLRAQSLELPLGRERSQLGYYLQKELDCSVMEGGAGRCTWSCVNFRLEIVVDEQENRAKRKAWRTGAKAAVRVTRVT